MPTTYLPPEDHIARHIRPRLVQRDEVTKEPIGIFPEAFHLRDTDRDLSVNWLEHFPGGRNEQLGQVINHSELQLKARDGFGVLRVGALSEVCERHGAKVRVIHDPTPKNPAHAAVHRYPRDNHALESTLANLAGQDLTMVGDVTNSSS
jgi:hypothetical protein